MKTNFTTVDEYIEASPSEVKLQLKKLRALIRKAAPKAEEGISYQMPAYKLHGMLVYFAGYRTHIGFYPTPGGIEAFKKELAGYPTSKGTIQFPVDKPLPLTLIKEIVKFRVAENLDKVKAKKK